MNEKTTVQDVIKLISLNLNIFQNLGLVNDNKHKFR